MAHYTRSGMHALRLSTAKASRPASAEALGPYRHTALPHAQEAAIVPSLQQMVK
eukprot:m.11170 g.11170  ORF g.11170 m.11170 type:complete len:54 (+) comp6403_c0_seq1:908-1069(+)